MGCANPQSSSDSENSVVRMLRTFPRSSGMSPVAASQWICQCGITGPPGRVWFRMFLLPVPETSNNERIDDAHAGVHEIRTVSRGDRQTVDGRRRRDEAILDRHGLPDSPKTSQ